MEWKWVNCYHFSLKGNIFRNFHLDIMPKVSLHGSVGVVFTLRDTHMSIELA